MRSKLILTLVLLIGLLFPMLPEQGGRAAAPSASGRATCASRIPVRANARPEAEGTGLGSFLPQDTTAAARDTARRRAPARTSSSSLPELTMPQVIPPSPAAMELAKYTAYPVDLSNGLVQISIPLYEIVDGDIRIPLALSYHASGIKPNARSCDWLGDGWSITGLPSLSRSINGGPDERVYDARIAALDNPTWEQLEYITSQTLDVALDEFYYSAGGHSGRLYFNQIPSGTTATTVHPVVIPKDPVKVTLPTANDFSQRIDITDPQGIAYHFGGASDNYYDKTYVSYGGTSHYVPTAWKVRAIQSRTTGRTVSFSWSSPFPETLSYRLADAVAMVDQITGAVTYNAPAVKVTRGGEEDRFFLYCADSTGGLGRVDPLTIHSPAGYTFPAAATVEVIQDNSYPETITFSGGSVSFVRNTSTAAARDLGLSAIVVRDAAGNTVRTITFQQTIHGLSTRPVLVLDAVTVSGPSSSSAEPEQWTFSYNSPVTDRDTRDIDRWGYYNAAGNSTLVPTVTTLVTVNDWGGGGGTPVPVTIPGGNREPNEAAMQQGMLTAITFPTGGRTEFVYEAHRYIDETTHALRSAGGLRIKQIREVESTGNTTYRNFTYSTTDTEGSAYADGAGLLNVIPLSDASTPDTLAIWYRETACHEFIPTGDHICSYKERVWTDNSMVNLFSDGGSAVSYPYVVETRSSDAAGIDITGQTRHVFNVTTQRPHLRYGTGIVNEKQDGWSRGEELSATVTAGPEEEDQTLVARSRTEWSLEYGNGSGNDVVNRWQVARTARVYGVDETLVAEQFRTILHYKTPVPQGRRLPAAKTEERIEQNGTFSTGEAYAYDAYNNLTQKTVTGSRHAGASSAPARITKYYYPQDISSSIHTAMVAANMVAVPVKTEELAGTVGSSSTTLLSTQQAGFSTTPVGSGSGTAAFQAIVPASESLTVNAAASDGAAPSSGTRTVTFNTYDKRGNVVERTGLDGRAEVYLWGYRGQYPVAKVLGSSWSAVKAKVDTAKLATGTPSQVDAQLAALRSAFAASPTVHVWTYTWKPLVGMLSETDPSGKVTAYAYDGLGRLTGVSARETAAASSARLIEDYAYHYNPTESSSGHNYVRTRTMHSASGVSGAYVEKTAYADGLGRGVEEVLRTNSSSFPSLVTLQEYDAFGRPAATFLPVALTSNNGGAWVAPATVKGRVFMTYSDVYGDSYPVYEESPRERVEQQHGPGSPWRTREKYTRTEWLVNKASASGSDAALSCACYAVASSTSLKKKGLWPAGELSVVRTTDEDGAVSLAFTDKWGRTLLERRVISGGTYADTYYVYDDLGLLRYVLTPEAGAALTANTTWSDSNATLQGQAYIYKYDARGRMTSKKLPGCGPVYIRYDKADRPVFTQDGVQRSSSLWTFTLRDVLGRECVTGTAAVASSAITAAATAVPTATFTTGSGGTALGGYTASGVTLPSGKTLRSVNYYDVYSFTSLLPSATAARLALTTLSGYGTAWPSNSAPDAKGLLTGTRKYVVDDGSSSFAAESLFYDWRSRPVQRHEVDPQGITTDAFLAYTFTGQVSGSREAVTLPAAVSATGADECTVTLKALSYDAWGRLTGESTTVGDGTTSGSISDVMAYSYDAVGRMTGRTYGSGTGAVTEALTYNVRGWVTAQSSPVFSSTLRYTDPSRSATTGKYDGSISEWTWSRGTGSTAQTYGFSYDGLGRLTGTKRYTDNGTTATNAFTEQGLVYDRNGNITALRRYGASASVAEDDFAFNVTGNRISSLTNTGTSGSGVTYTSYTYDANGNTTHDGRTGQDLAWNELNLISGVSTTSGGNTSQLASYTWMADGAKYASARADGSGYVYKGALVFERNAAGKLSLDAALTTGGRITAQKDASTGAITGYTVHHHITDHLGSVRAVVDFAGNILETSDFLPYGTRWSQTGGSAAGTLTDATNRWRYSGKEEQGAALNPALPLIDYGARMYDPAIARWMSVDPMAEKYYPMGGYGYCAGRPINVIDPEGMDWWEIDNTGRVVNYEKSEDSDSFFMVSQGEDGSYQRTGQSISFDSRTIKRTDSVSSSMFSFAFTSENKGAELFKFLADNTNVEIGFISTISGKALVFSDQKEDRINLIGPAIAISKGGETVTSTIHSHPKNNPPSGYGENYHEEDSDKIAASHLEFSQGYRTNHYVYLPQKSSLILYDSDKSYKEAFIPWNTLYY